MTVSKSNAPKPDKITIREIETFVVLAGCECVEEAAEKLGCGSSDVIKQRKSLQKKLGGSQLFDQRGPRVYLNEEGKRYLKHAQLIRMAARAGLASFEKPLYVEPKCLRLVYVESPTALFLPEALQRFNVDHPGVKIVEDTPWADKCVALVKQRKADVGLTIQPEPPISEPTYEELVRYRLLCAIFEKNTLAEQKTISLLQMVSERLLLMGSDAAQYNRWMRIIFAPVGGIKHWERCSNFNSQLAKVAADRGIAVVPYPMKRLIGDLPIKLLRIEPDWFIGVGALWPRQVIPAAKDFVDAARSVIQSQFKQLKGNALPPERKPTTQIKSPPQGARGADR